QQRRLAGAIGAQHADLGAVEERQIDAAQDLPLGRDDLAQILHDERILTSHLYMGASRWPPIPLLRSGRPGKAVAALDVRSFGAPAKPWRSSISPYQPSVLGHHAAVLDDADAGAGQRGGGRVV